MAPPLRSWAPLGASSEPNSSGLGRGFAVAHWRRLAAVCVVGRGGPVDMAWTEVFFYEFRGRQRSGLRITQLIAGSPCYCGCFYKGGVMSEREPAR